MSACALDMLSTSEREETHEQFNTLYTAFYRVDVRDDFRELFDMSSSGVFGD